jgi:hypothetical protein
MTNEILDVAEGGGAYASMDATERGGTDILTRETLDVAEGGGYPICGTINEAEGVGLINFV